MNQVAGVTQVYARRFSGGIWQSLGTGSDILGGISSALAGTNIQDVAVSTRAGRVAVAWTQIDATTGVRNVHLRETTGGNWNEIAGSASGSGVSAVIGTALGGVPTRPYPAHLGLFRQ